jgi:hypothetical protein
MVSEEKLQDMARHVAYERVQMRRSRQVAWKHLQEHQDAVGRGEDYFNQWVRTDLLTWETKRNALLESILLHYRNLLEFLAPSLSRISEQSVVARDFRDVPVPIKYKKRINTLLSHVSKKRADMTQEQRIWDELEGMLAELEEAWQGFLSSLAANYPERVDWFRVYDVEELLEEAGEEQ